MKEIIKHNGKYHSEVDVAVLLLFFTRTNITKCTFEQIRKARPSRLYLYQDGAREGCQDDIQNIVQCREAIESMIDWECEIHKFYQEKNHGCDPSEYISQKSLYIYLYSLHLKLQPHLEQPHLQPRLPLKKLF